VSEVDTRLGALERQRFVQEVQHYLPAFLGSASTDHVDPVGDVTRLLNLTRQDLRRVVAVHLALSQPIAAFIHGLQQGLRHPTSSSIRPRVASQAVTGPIDWGATVAHQAGSGWNMTSYVVRPARRVFDTPENQALVWLLERLGTELRVAVPADLDRRSGVHDQAWWNRILEARARLAESRRFAWVRGVLGARPGVQGWRRLQAARSAFYQVLIPGALRQTERFTESPSADDISELISQRYFEPERDWQLFELVVALRVAQAFAEVSSGKRQARLLVGGSAGPYARYRIPDGSEIRLWYQSWPHHAGASEHGQARRQYSIKAGPPRPDLVVEKVRGDSRIDCVLLELKASRDSAYLGGGLTQLLGYMRDRPQLFAKRPAGWLVAPRSEAFTSRPSGDLDLWAIDADNVAGELINRLMG
jgi:hypothetical protein